jgi:hypothetical protein
MSLTSEKRKRTTEVSSTGCWARTAAISLTLAAPGLPAASFSSAHYDSKTNELVVTLNYGGSNPDHQFAIQWGQCQPLGDDGTQHQIAAQVLDSQWNDDEQQTFTETVRFSLAGVSCRPATVTLRTAPPV